MLRVDFMVFFFVHVKLNQITRVLYVCFNIFLKLLLMICEGTRILRNVPINNSTSHLCNGPEYLNPTQADIWSDTQGKLSLYKPWSFRRLNMHLQ